MRDREQQSIWESYRKATEVDLLEAQPPATPGGQPLQGQTPATPGATPVGDAAAGAPASPNNAPGMALMAAIQGKTIDLGQLEQLAIQNKLLPAQASRIPPAPPAQQAPTVPTPQPGQTNQHGGNAAWQ